MQAVVASPACAFPWVPDQRDGTFCNPVLHADYSDPDVIRHGDDFFLVASSFQCTPGLPILHSKDLVSWTLVAHALKNLPHPRFVTPRLGCGVWAPSIRRHAGRFWIFFAMPDEGIYATTAAHPAGEWSAPWLVQEGKGLIDPCPLWNDDGSAYLVHAYAHSRAGIRDQLRIRPMSADGMRLLGEGRIVFHEPLRHPTLEGPKLLKRDGWYYILAPAGGVVSGWQVALRSRDVYGPYEDRMVLAQGATSINGPHQGALVDAPDGSWWFVHFQHAGVYGRITHLQPARWEDGWPRIGAPHDGDGVGEPVARFRKPVARSARDISVPQTSDEFDSPLLGLQWQWNANHDDRWLSLESRRGWLRLFPQTAPRSGLGMAPNLLLQKFPARSFAVETALELSCEDPNEEAGLIVNGWAHAALALRQSGRAQQIVLRRGDAERIVGEASGRPSKLRVTVSDGGLCRFGFDAGDGRWVGIDDSFQAQPGIWIGAKVGLYAIKPGKGRGGYADFDYVRFGPVAVRS